MTRGRTQKPAIDPLRARWWYRLVARAVASELDIEHINALQLGEALRGRGVWSTQAFRQWYQYANGKRSPSAAVLNAVESFYPGTRRVFEYGPDFSYLWEALVGDPRTAVSRTEDEWRNGVSAKHVAALPRGRMLSETGQWVDVEKQEAVQDLVIPRDLAAQWGVVQGQRLNFAQKHRPWQRLQQLCGQKMDGDVNAQVYRHSAGVLLSCAPSATATIQERSTIHPFIILPYFAGLAYLIARARSEGRTEVVLPDWNALKPRLGVDDSWQHPRDRSCHQSASMWEQFSEVSRMSFRFEWDKA